MKLNLVKILLVLVLTHGIAQAQWLPTNATTGNIYYNNGNVGVGTSTPGAPLEVRAANNPWGTIRVNTMVAGEYSSFGIYENNARRWAFYNHPGQSNNLIMANKEDHDKFFFTQDGKMGIGTAPEAKFTISQIGNGWNDGLRINRDATNYLTLTEDVSDIRLRNWGSGGILFYTSSGLVTILNNGNMGIGASNPQKRLHVEAASGEVLRLSMPQTYVANAGPEIAFWNGTSEELASIAGVFKDSNQGNYGNLVFKTRTNDQVKLETKMVIQANGNVGIGTTEPGSFKLAVNGKIWSQEVNIEMTNPGPDYVFEKDYNLLSLAELEAYIKANKHLPEVPSAKEMEADGLNLKEMNLILLKKVEELTLHLIEQKKVSDNQQKMISVLMDKVSDLEHK